MNFEQAKEYVLEFLRRELPDNLYYHNVDHTLAVLEAVEAIGRSENVCGDDMTLLKTAALYHDTGFTRQYDANEVVACDIARETLPRFDYSTTQIEQVCHIIMGTIWPHNPSCLFQKIICDADLYYIGTEKFYATSVKLREELAAHDVAMSDEEWIDLEVNFLENQRFFTATCCKKLEPLKNEYLNELKALKAKMQ